MAQPAFRVGFAPGVTPDKWATRWRERERRPLELVRLEEAEQREALDAGRVQMALVRRPLDEDGLHLIPLYEEQPVVVVSVEHELSLLEELTTADLDGAVVNTGPVAEAVATTAAGTGVVLVPMSVARAHHRKDVTFRVLRDAEPTYVALAWRRDLEDDGVETFIGVVRGRSASSSRDAQERDRAAAPAAKPRTPGPDRRRGAARGRRRR